MTKITKLTLICLLASFGAFAQITTPIASPSGSFSTRVGLTDVTIDYFRPGVKGRKIFGEGSDFLQPYGQFWRAGANTGTTITFTSDAKVGGVDIEGGTYLILATPGKDNWRFVLYSDPSIGANLSAVEDDKIAVDVNVPNVMLSSPAESLTYLVSDISADNTTANIHFMWADHSYKVPIEVSYDEMVMADIKAKTTVNPGNYMQAANYYLTTGKDLNQALEWANMYLAIEGNERQFWNVHTKAQILAKLGKKKEAIAAAEKSIEIAKGNEGGDFGYVKRNQDLIDSLK